MVAQLYQLGAADAVSVAVGSASSAELDPCWFVPQRSRTGIGGHRRPQAVHRNRRSPSLRLT
jgi:hypothetical protein